VVDEAGEVRDDRTEHGAGEQARPKITDFARSLVASGGAGPHPASTVAAKRGTATAMGRAEGRDIVDSSPGARRSARNAAGSRLEANPRSTNGRSPVRKLNIDHKWLRVLAWFGIGAVAALLVGAAILGDWRRVYFFAGFGGAAVVFMLLDERLPALFDVLFVASAILSGIGWSWDPQPWANVYNEVNHFFTSFALTLSLGYLAFESVRALLRPHPIIFALAIASFGVAIGAVWEIFEWAIGQIGSIEDTILDLALDTAGAVLAGWLASWAARHEVEGG
jgi:hypothetical protein